MLMKMEKFIIKMIKMQEMNIELYAIMVKMHMRKIKEIEN